MARKNLSKSQSAEPQETTAGRQAALDSIMAERVRDISEGLAAMSLMLYRAQDRAEKAGIQDLVGGVESLLDHYSGELARVAEVWEPKAEGGAA